MAGKIMRAVLLGVLGFILAAGAAGFLLVRSAGVAADNLSLLARTRGRELAVAVATMAGESMSGAATVRLASTLQRIAATSRGRADAFEIQEIAVIDREGQVLAHSDIARAAEKAEPVFQGEKFEATLNLPERDPVSFEVTEAKSPKLPLPAFAEEFRAQIEEAIPALPPIPSKMLISAAVFRVDEDSPSARLHIVVVLRSSALFQSGLPQLVLESLIACGAVGVLFLLVGLVLPAGGKAEPGPTVSHHEEQGEAERRSAEAAEPLTEENLQAEGPEVPMPEPIVMATPESSHPATASAPPAMGAALAAGAVGAAVGAGVTAAVTAGPSPQEVPARSSYSGDRDASTAEAPRSVRIAAEDEIPDAIPLD